MIPAVAQTLVNLLTSGTSLDNAEQISFSLMESHLRPGLSLYCYDVHPANQKLCNSPEDGVQQAGAIQPSIAPSVTSDQGRSAGLNISFLITAHDQTMLGTQQLLSEALLTLCQYESIPEKLLAPTLQGYGALPLIVCQMPNPAALWCAMGLPLRPAVYITITVPLNTT